MHHVSPLADLLGREGYLTDLRFHLQICIHKEGIIVEFTDDHSLFVVGIERIVLDEGKGSIRDHNSLQPLMVHP